MASKTPKLRRPLRDLEKDHANGNTQALDDLMYAWHGIQQLNSSDKRSFFVLGGYHGEPFQDRPEVDDLTGINKYDYWGGYCNHGNILFPTWHRVYLLKLEKALQSIKPDVTLPYWDETSDDTFLHGLPKSFTDESYSFPNGKTIPNPLKSYTLPKTVRDIPGHHNIYTKPAKYETKRYPMSGLWGTPEAILLSKAHNKKYEKHAVEYLNKNITTFLADGPTSPSSGKQGVVPIDEFKPDAVRTHYVKCLDAPNYTLFSNTTSMRSWNQANNDDIVALEDPHNNVHLSVGGFYNPFVSSGGFGEYGLVPWSNGDMGENNTAGLDPIFFFHHCFVDRVFWAWQEKHKKTDKLSILTKDDGAYIPNAGQGPAVGQKPGSSLTLDSPLSPFTIDEFGNTYTSNDCINIEKLGYTYAKGSLEEIYDRYKKQGKSPTKALLKVSGINRALFHGSFLLFAFADVKHEETDEKTTYYLGKHAVFSRYEVKRCLNCLTHLEVAAQFYLQPLLDADVNPKDSRVTYRIEVQHRSKELPQGFKYDLEVVC